MKYLLYAVAAFCSILLFFPKTGTSEIRNLPLLIAILAIVAIGIAVRFLKCVLLFCKAKKALARCGVKLEKVRFFPWASLFHGQYSLTFFHENRLVEMVLLSRKRKYRRYHFESVEKLEFYRANRVVFRNSHIRGATISNLVEVQRVGRQRIRWDPSAQVRVILFDRLPDHITDSVKREYLGAGERICGSDVCLLDWQDFCKRLFDDRRADGR